MRLSKAEHTVCPLMRSSKKITEPSVRGDKISPTVLEGTSRSNQVLKNSRNLHPKTIQKIDKREKTRVWRVPAKLVQIGFCTNIKPERRFLWPSPEPLRLPFLLGKMTELITRAHCSTRAHLPRSTFPASGAGKLWYPSTSSASTGAKWTLLSRHPSCETSHQCHRTCLL
jgi:hypothetical protein